MRSMKNTTCNLFCNANVQIGKLDILSPSISDKITTGTPVKQGKLIFQKQNTS